MNKPANPSPWPYGWIAFGAACSAVLISLVWLANSAFADDSMPLQRRYSLE